MDNTSPIGAVVGRMIFFLVVGMVLATAFGKGVAGMIVPFAVLLAVLAGLYVWCFLIPSYSAALSRGNLARRRRLLGLVIATPLVPDSLKIVALAQLLEVEQKAHRFLEGALVGERLLGLAGTPALPPGLESEVRQARADCLEAMGRKAEAQEERRVAKQATRRGERDAVSLQADAKLLERDNRHAEAYELYQQALEIASGLTRAQRFELLLRLSLCAFNVARAADCLKWAEAAIETDPDHALTASAYRMAAIGSNHLGRLDEAEAHARKAVERAPDVKNRIESLALLAEYLMRQGKLDEAERTARDAEALAPRTVRTPWTVVSEVERLRGHYDAAIEALREAEKVPASPIPAMNRRMAAVVNRHLAALLARGGRGEEALAALRAAEPDLLGDAKLRVELEAIAALVHGVRGEIDLARARLDAAEERVGILGNDALTERAAYYTMALAALQIDDVTRAERCLLRYRELQPVPVYYPHILYMLATCRRQLGDLAGGRALDAEAAAFTFGTEHERLARERLAGEAVDTADVEAATTEDAANE